jgi:hypothetical protein
MGKLSNGAMIKKKAKTKDTAPARKKVKKVGKGKQKDTDEVRKEISGIVKVNAKDIMVAVGRERHQRRVCTCDIRARDGGSFSLVE